MGMLDLFKQKILTPGRIARLLNHVFQKGIQLSNVIHMGEDDDVIALQYKETVVSYSDLFKLIASVSGYVNATYKVRQGSNVLIIVDNSIPSVVLLFALSALGCNIHILPPMKDYEQFRRTVNFSEYDFIFSAVETGYDYYSTAPLYFITPAWDQAASHDQYEPFVRRSTNISIFTSGSTGVARRAQRKNTLLQYLNAISDIVKTLRLQDYPSVLLPVPIYHSYGLSTLFLSLMLHKCVFLVNKFDAQDVARDIKTNRLEAAVLIPQMLNRLLDVDLSSLRCVISCGDVLPGRVVQEARKKLGDIVFNLYGTSETGLATIATPEMLAVNPNTIGRPIKGCKLKLEKENGIEILHIQSGFATERGFVRTGDIASRDERGWYYVHGRSDDLIVINGTNVYPLELIRMSYSHPLVQYAEARAFTDENGFKKIRMILLVKADSSIDEQQFKEWWIARYGTKFLPAIVQFKTDDDHIKLMRT